MEKEIIIQLEDNIKKNINFTSKMTKEEEDWYYYEAWLRERRMIEIEKEREYEELVNNRCND